MAIHRLWRFPRGEDDWATHRSNATRLVQYLSDEEFASLEDFVWTYHSHHTAPNQCCSIVIHRIKAPVPIVWSVVRRFDNPQAYKRFIRSCSMRGDGQVGSTRELELISGIPAASSTERLEILDEEKHILSFKIVGGEHRLNNYHSVTTLHESVLDGGPATIIIESYVVDVPQDNTKEDTRIFADTIVKLNLHTLGQISENRFRCQQGGEAINI